MRSAAVVVTALWLAACGARGSNVPAWPERAEREADGGESIAPRESTAVAAVESDDTDVAADTAPAAAAATTPAAASATTPAVTAPTITAPDDTITIEEIVIEISEDSD